MKFIFDRIKDFMELFYSKQLKIGKIPTYDYLPDDDNNSQFSEIDLWEDWD